MADETIRVRMYSIGFGDSFLVGFPAKDRERLILIDCGVHNASKRGADIPTEVIPDILAEAGAAGGKPRLDVVVATHHHLDHVSGFRFEGWDDVEVGEVWLPWTEDPTDEVARKIRDRQSKQAAFLLGLAAADSKWETVRAVSENNAGYTNAAAMTTLHDGFAGEPQRFFLPQPDGQARARRFSPPGVPGLEVTVLGPSRDESVIRDMNPPSSESYFRLGKDRMVALGGQNLPFDQFYVDPLDYKAKNAALVPPHTSDLKNVAKAGRLDALALAVALEQATNGTSLVLALRFGDTTLLFPGDAQWGTWDRMLHDAESQEVLRSINFYKVGHHGSHNATPVSFVSGYLQGTEASMVSVAPTSIPSWKDIPRKPLLGEIEKRTAVLLDSDVIRQAALAGAPAPAAANVTVGPNGLWTEIRLPANR
jgi:beta-lactamase superfamily II metal-dependent hydrolase